MYKIFSCIIFICSCISVARAQHVYQIRADSVRIYNVCDTAELIIENRTRGVAGYLYNKGNGRTEFRQLELKQIGGSQLAILGQDTIDLAQMSGVGGIDTIYRVGDSIRYVKKGVVKGVFAPLSSTETLQSVTNRGFVSARDEENLTLKKVSATPGGLFVRFRNSDNSERGYMGYGSSGNNSFIIHTNDNSSTKIMQRLLVNSMADDDGSGLQVNNNARIIGRIMQVPQVANPVSNTAYQFWNAMGGAHLTGDPEFRQGNNGLSVYNQFQNTAINITRSNDVLTQRVPNSSGYHLRVTHTNPSGLTSPGLGGVQLIYPSKPNAVYVTRIRALIPVGYNLVANYNPFGNNSNSTWLTGNQGTGKWEDYIHLFVAGNDGSFSTIAYYSLMGPMVTTTWYIGYYDFKLSTGASWIDNVKQDTLTGRPLALWLGSDSTRLDQGAGYSLRITTPKGNVQMGPQNDSYMHFTTDRENFYFSKPVLAFNKLAIYNSGQSSASTTYLAQTEGRINNSPILTEAFAGGNYIRKLVDTVQSGNLWMKGMIKTDNTFASKISGGYASYRLHNALDEIRFGIGLSNSEGPANSGSDFSIWRYEDGSNTGIPTMTIARTNGAVNFPGVVTIPNNSRVNGTNSGVTNYSYLGFYNNKSNRVGYVGKGGNNNMDIHLASDSGNIMLFPSGSSNLSIGATQMAYNGGILSLNNGAGNSIQFSASGAAAPAYTTRSAGVRLVISPSLSASTVDYGMGIESNHLWFSTSTVGTGFKWYAGTNAIGTFTGNGNLSVTGSMTATAFNQSSLRSLKKDIQPFNTSAISVLANAQVRTFRFKADSTQHLYIGFIADELPDEMSSNGRQGVDQASTVGLLVKAIQELKAEKDALEVRLTVEKKALEDRLSAIEALLKSPK